MKQREINENPEWTYWLPDALADWSAPSHWERERLISMQKHLKQGDVLYDVGTEHGWMTAVYGGFCGYENLVLFEPSVDLWTNIRLIWEHNEFPSPLACFQALVGEHSNGDIPNAATWPDCAFTGEETGDMHYRSLVHHTGTIPTIAIDDLAIGVDAITIDVEGAELAVLKGAGTVLSSDRPLVWVSIHPDLMLKDFGTTPADIHEFMADHDYEGVLLEIDHEEHWLFTPNEYES